MLIRHLKLFISFVMLLHFMGITQVLSGYSKDKTCFIKIASMTEEENKKEKDSKEDDVETKDFKQKRPLQIASLVYGEKSFEIILASESVEHQFSADQLSPPPDFIG